MQSSEHVPKRYTTAEQQKILTAYRRSQRSVREFAARAGIAGSTLYRWLSTPARPAARRRPAFVEVPKLLTQAPAPALYRLHLGEGIGLEIGRGFATEEVATLLHLLRAL